MIRQWNKFALNRRVQLLQTRSAFVQRHELHQYTPPFAYTEWKSEKKHAFNATTRVSMNKFFVVRFVSLRSSRALIVGAGRICTPQHSLSASWATHFVGAWVQRQTLSGARRWVLDVGTLCADHRRRHHHDVDRLTYRHYITWWLCVPIFRFVSLEPICILVFVSQSIWKVCMCVCGLWNISNRLNKSIRSVWSKRDSRFTVISIDSK